MTCRGDDIPWRGTPYQTVLSFSFDKTTLQHLVTGERGMPLPQAMGGYGCTLVGAGIGASIIGMKQPAFRNWFESSSKADNFWTSWAI